MKTVLLLILMAFSAQAAKTNWPAAKVPDKVPGKSLEAHGNRLVAKRGNKASREFPVMFDILSRSRRSKSPKK